MRILDRYVLGMFVKNYLISFFVLVGMYVVLDMVFNFDEFVPTQAARSGGLESLWTTFTGVADYYFYQAFLIFVHLSGVIPVVAAAFTLIRLSRNNELTALLAAGVPLIRVAMPVILVAVMLNALVWVDTEVIIPTMIPKLIRKHGEAVEETGGAGGGRYGLQHMRDGNNLVSAVRYNPPAKEQPASMDGVEIVRRDKDYNVVSTIRADVAKWDASARRWRLSGGQDVKGVGKAAVATPVEVYEGSGGVTPGEIAVYRAREQRAYTIRAMQDQDKNLLVATKFFPATGARPAEMETVDIIFRDKETLDPSSHLTADAAVWDGRARKWQLVNGRLVRGLLPGQKHEGEALQVAWESNITPDEIALYRSREYVELLPTRRINELLNGPNSYGTIELLRVKHFRNTQPLINVVLLLLAIPCVLLREPGGIKLAAAKCLVLVGVCMGTVFLAQQMAGVVPAGMGANWPALMAWVPVLVFGPVSIFLLERVRT